MSDCVEPNPPKGVRRLERRDAEAAELVRRFLVRRSGTPRDPGAAGSAHGWVERGDEASGRLAHVDSFVTGEMLVRLAVRKQNQRAAVEVSSDVRHHRFPTATGVRATR